MTQGEKFDEAEREGHGGGGSGEPEGRRSTAPTLERDQAAHRGAPDGLAGLRASVSTSRPRASAAAPRSTARQSSVGTGDDEVVDAEIVDEPGAGDA